jgi:hypothetical protein
VSACDPSYQKLQERMKKFHNTAINKNDKMSKLYSLILTEKSHEIVEVMLMNMKEDEKKKRKTCSHMA